MVSKQQIGKQSTNGIVDYRRQVSEAEKYKNDKEWAKKVADRLIPNFNTSSELIFNWKTDLSNYRLVNGILQPEDFERYNNPMKLDLENDNDVLQPYIKVSQKVNVLLGEELNRNEDVTPYLLSQRALWEKDEELKAKWKEYARIEFQKHVSMVKVELGELSEEELQQRMAELQQEHTPEDLDYSKYMSAKEEKAHRLLQYVKFDQDVKLKKNEAFRDGLITGKEFVYVGVRNGKPVIEKVNPVNFFSHKGSEVKFVEDGDWAGRRMSMTIAEVLREFSNDLSESDINTLYQKYGHVEKYPPDKVGEMYRENTTTNRWLQGRGGATLSGHLLGHTTGDLPRNFFYQERVWVTHITWKSPREIGFLTTLNEYGEEETEVVDGSYPIPEHAIKSKFINDADEEQYQWTWDDEEGRPYKIVYYWIPRVWEATRIDSDIYVKVREIPNQPFSISNPYKCKLPYHGAYYEAYNAPYTSMVSRMKPYQMLYIITLDQFVELLSRNLGKLTNFELSSVPRELAKEGKNPIEMLMFYARKGFTFSDATVGEQGAGIHTRSQPVYTVDQSVAGDLLNLAQLCDWLDHQIGEAGFVPKQREGQFAPRSNVTDNQQTLVQASYMTEPYFFVHAQIWTRILESFLNVMSTWLRRYFKRHPNSKEVFLQYILPDKEKAVLRMEREDLDNFDIGLYLTSTNAMEQYMLKMESYMLPFIQNQMEGLEEVSTILKARAEGASPTTIHEMIEALTRKRDAKQADMQQQRMRELEMQIQANKEQKNEEHMQELEKIIVKEEESRETKLAVEEVKQDDGGSILEREKLELAREKINKDYRAKMQAQRRNIK